MTVKELTVEVERSTLSKYREKEKKLVELIKSNLASRFHIRYNENGPWDIYDERPKHIQSSLGCQILYWVEKIFGDISDNILSFGAKVATISSQTSPPKSGPIFNDIDSKQVKYNSIEIKVIPQYLEEFRTFAESYEEFSNQKARISIGDYGSF